MSDVLFAAHSGIRYAVLLAGVLAALAAIAGLARVAGAYRPAALLGTIFVGLVDLQVVVGLVLLIVRGFYPQLIGHVMTMIVAVIVAHGFAVAAKKREPERASGVRLVGVAITLALIAAGIMAIGRPIL